MNQHENGEGQKPLAGEDSDGYRLKAKPEGAAPPSPNLRWCPFVGNWCKGHDCYCELTLFA